MSTNQAIDRLPERLKTRLSTPAHVDELRTYIKYHVVPNAPVCKNLSNNIMANLLLSVGLFHAAAMLGSTDGVAVRALVFHQGHPGSNSAGLSVVRLLGVKQRFLFS